MTCSDVVLFKAAKGFQLVCVTEKPVLSSIFQVMWLTWWCWFCHWDTLWLSTSTSWRCSSSTWGIRFPSEMSSYYYYRYYTSWSYCTRIIFLSFLPSNVRSVCKNSSGLILWLQTKPYTSGSCASLCVTMITCILLTQTMYIVQLLKNMLLFV